ncbi:MAG: hypothetical protein HC911_18060 [Chloroflexaceae bacterium]|nr:hypothetical protein [Chloroflexaceae bacterium]
MTIDAQAVTARPRKDWRRAARGASSAEPVAAPVSAGLPPEQAEDDELPAITVTPSELLPEPATGKLAAEFWQAVASMPNGGAEYANGLNTGDLEAAHRLARQAQPPQRGLLLAGCIKAYEIRALTGLAVPPAERLGWLPVRMGNPVGVAQDDISSSD